MGKTAVEIKNLTERIRTDRPPKHDDLGSRSLLILMPDGTDGRTHVNI